MNEIEVPPLFHDLIMIDNNTPASGFKRVNDVTLIGFISVDSALDFDT